MCEPVVETFTIKFQNHTVHAFKKLLEMLEGEIDCDLEINGTESYKAHSIVLNCFGRFPNPIEVSTDKDDTTIKNQEDTIKKIVNFCYTGTLEISNENMFDVCEAALNFDMPFVLEEAVNFLKSLIDVNNCFRMLKFGRNIKELEVAVLNYINFNFLEVCNTLNFLELEYNQLEEFLKSKNLNVTEEIDIYNCVNRWISHKKDERGSHLIDLLKLVKLNLLPENTILSELKNNCDLSDCTKLMIEALQSQKEENEKKTKADRRNPNCLVLIVGDLYKNLSKKATIYNPENKKITDFVDLKTSSKNYNAVILGDNLITLGGLNIEDDTPSNIVKMYNFQTKNIKDLPKMGSKRNFSCAVVVHNKLYVVGGYDGTKVLNSIERYDLRSNKWSDLTQMPTARAGCAGIVVKNDIYIIGGNNGKQCLKTVEAFCPQTNSWKTCAPMITPRSYFSVAIVKDYVYVVGGTSALRPEVNLKVVEKYDTISNTWTLIDNITFPRSGLGLCAVGSNLLVIGGKYPRGSSEIMEEYNTFTQKWTKAEFRCGRTNFTAITISKSHFQLMNPGVVIN